MLISLNWLKQYIDLDGIEINEMENSLTMIGQEVEKIEIAGSNLENVVTAKIIEKEMHPDSDHLTVCKVDNGKEILQIVCGASNHKAGDKVVLAQIGAKLSEDFVIKKGKIRGKESCGMLCSEVELGIGSDKDGIIILPEDAPIGVPFKDYLGINDTVFELEITPNRPDCLSHIGIARELSAYYGKELKYPETEIKNEIEEKTSDNVKVTIEDSNLSRRYVTRILKNVTVKESPKWLKERIESVGLRSINNIVDVSNFILMEINHPNHVFDLDKIEGNEIKVKSAVKGDKLVTLDEQERELEDGDIVICDSKKILALGGVMGGLDSEVTDNTKNILLEVAQFNPQNVRKTSRRLTLSSDSSYRFERGIDVEDSIKVINRLANLIQEVAGGEILNGYVDVYPVPYENKVAELNFERLNRFVGKVIPREKVIEILRNLEIDVKDNGETLTLTAPSYRGDLELEQDYFEEVIRMYGFDNIENILPRVDINKNSTLDTTKLTDRVKTICASVGLKEVINYSFIPKDALQKLKFTGVSEDKLIDISNPITEDFVTMRPTLLYSLIKNAKDNMNRNVSNIRFFEVSRTFEKAEELAKEDIKVGIILAGENDKTLWNPKPVHYDFYDLKGIVEEIFSKLKFQNFSIKRSVQTEFHPGRSADVFVGKEYIGSFGEIHPDVLENFGLNKKTVLVAEFNIELIKKYINKPFVYQGIVKYPAVPRDLALVMNENILVGDVLKTIEKIDKKVEKVELFDIYQGIGVEPGKKSVAISILLRDDSKTLEEKEINDIIDKILAKMKKDYMAELRQ
ncbi:phenylalanine--tRNA ligase, beta subunit [Leptotrichia sp. oral taxon 215 str. W9775]|uniref:phenylalanine--tRNA ligase subunit beta n=1 Tax=Leptotrichia sp. oral taxon 215 TaxID=712359 RepID=UPI0003AD9087|nr:phenylalanine--tRNA ligase subunit beta [Leptotrichia sp. oral taxon 215]ERK68610.1 phenylalanine--tRNA ligase, beta subunit [Leptotrichia sp. oral taxon 215 str. W9775]